MQERSGATCHMAMPQCCYLANGAKRPSHTTNMQTFSNKSSSNILAVTMIQRKRENNARLNFNFQPIITVYLFYVFWELISLYVICIYVIRIYVIWDVIFLTCGEVFVRCSVFIAAQGTGN